MDSLRKNDTLLSLNLSYTQFLEDCLPSILKMLEENTTLINLELSNQTISDNLSLRKIQNMIMQNQRRFHQERIAEKEERLGMKLE